MTIKEFDEKKWFCGDRCVYQGKTYDVASVDFIEKLVGFDHGGENLSWVRCENVTICEEKEKFMPDTCGSRSNYYYANASNYLCIDRWQNRSIDWERYESGNCYETMRDAKDNGVCQQDTE